MNTNDKSIGENEFLTKLYEMKDIVDILITSSHSINKSSSEIKIGDRVCITNIQNRCEGYSSWFDKYCPDLSDKYYDNTIIHVKDGESIQGIVMAKGRHKWYDNPMVYAVLHHNIIFLMMENDIRKL